MRTEKINGYKVELYDSIDQLPMDRYHYFNKYVMVDAGIGSNVEDAHKRIDSAIQMIAKEDKRDAINELNNLKQNLEFVIGNVSPKMLSFATLVKSIDGKKYNDMSPEGLGNVVQKLGETGVSYGMLKSIFDFVKKKLKLRSGSTSRKSRMEQKSKRFLYT